MNRIFRLEMYRLTNKIKEYFGNEIDEVSKLAEEEFGIEKDKIKSLLITFTIMEMEKGKILIKK
ncbi:hypothetical protein LCGC14_1941540 [marine sediment metagenome]|uniref:Uncharacterized protein n=1 Tax=marine sediment metagenome TaxID=412755 RepID=A0A0F9G8R2_9ZZZZ